MVRCVHNARKRNDNVALVCRMGGGSEALDEISKPSSERREKCGPLARAVMFCGFRGRWKCVDVNVISFRTVPASSRKRAEH